MNRVGRYELTELLGQGGMGTVYKAYDPLLARVLAIKVISTQLHAQPELRDRFFREARAAAQLAHRNIVTVFDLGEQDGLPFLAMQFLEGRDLERRMRAPEGMSLARKIEIGLAVAEGLAHAHGSGVIHRDIKPANIFITDDGQVKILDFGLARLISSELTRSNMMVGTVSYMSPEQLRGEKTDHRSDIFSLGVVLYELFGGKKPFQADSFASTMLKILQEIPEPLELLDPELPPHVIAVVDRAIAKAREDRYQLMIDLLRDLEAAYEPIRGSDRRIISQVESALRPAEGAKPKSHPPVFIASPDAPTIAGTLVPEAIRMTSGPPLAPTVELVPPSGLTRRTTPWRAYAFGATALLLAALAIVVFRGRNHPTPTTPAETPRDRVSVPADPVASPAASDSRAPSLPPPSLPAPVEPAEAPGVGADRNQSHPPEADLIGARVTRAVREARAALAGGRHDEAAQAASEALALDRTNRDAQQILTRVTAIERDHADRAARALSAAKAAAVSANAREMVPELFSAAERQETDAQAASGRQQYAAAAARIETAATLFRSAEAAARGEVEARAARARAAEQARHNGEPAAPRPDAPPPPPAPAPAPVPAPAPAKVEAVQLPPQTRISSREAVATAVQRYTAALEHRDISALKSVWPSLSGTQQTAIEAEFANARSIDVTFVNPRIDVAGATATMTGRRQYSLLTRDGQQLRSETITTIGLRQVGSDWIIESVRHQAAR